jgi:hypothetical protein
MCKQNAAFLNVSENCTCTTPVSVPIYVEVCNLGNTKWINKGYNLPAIHYVKMFYTTYVLTKINFLLCTTSVLVFIPLCPAFECDVFKAVFVKWFSTP